MRFGWMEIAVVFGLIVLLFGAKKLPELARALGKSLKEFKKGTKDVLEEDSKESEDKENKKDKKGDS